MPASCRPRPGNRPGHSDDAGVGDRRTVAHGGGVTTGEGEGKEAHEDGALTLATCVRLVRAEEVGIDDGLFDMRLPTREEVA